jgi:hypothetical protein
VEILYDELGTVTWSALGGRGDWGTKNRLAVVTSMTPTADSDLSFLTAIFKIENYVFRHSFERKMWS